tara:strand:- start:6200 stop:6730 length:531 start_codon:yes stop_codon:yes gene_type:complete
VFDAKERLTFIYPPRFKSLLSPARKQQTGSSLLEVLIALLIMAIGLLGLASVQIISLKNLNNSQFRSLATAYAYEMAERMRSNRPAVSAGSYDTIDASATDPGCTSCTSTQIAQLDAYQWNQSISSSVASGGLPTGNGTVLKNGSVFDIKVSWQEQQQNSDGGIIDDANFTLSVQL